jgi:hypothetical protein
MMKIERRKDFICYRAESKEDIHPLKDFLFRNSHILYGYSVDCSLTKRWSYQFGLMRHNKDRNILLKDKYNDKPKKPSRQIWKVDIRCRNFNIYTGKSDG